MSGRRVSSKGCPNDFLLTRVPGRGRSLAYSRRLDPAVAGHAPLERDDQSLPTHLRLAGSVTRAAMTTRNYAPRLFGAWLVHGRQCNWAAPSFSQPPP